MVPKTAFHLRKKMHCDIKDGRMEEAPPLKLHAWLCISTFYREGAFHVHAHKVHDVERKTCFSPTKSLKIPGFALAAGSEF